MAKGTHITQYIFGRALLGTLGLLPLPVASLLGAGIGYFVATLPASTNTISRRNIRLCLPHLSEKEVKNIHTKATQNFIQTLLEMPALYKLNAKNFHKYVEVENFEFVKNNPGVFILTAHFGNWETISKTLAINGVAMASIYRKANNPYIDKYVTNLRTQDAGGVMIPKGTSGARGLIKAVKSGMTAGFLNDQKLSDGIDVTFFGQPVKSPSAIADLALKYNRKICPVFCTRVDLCKFKVTFEKPFEVEDTGHMNDDAQKSIQAMNNLMQQRIEEHPSHWLWHHKRFK